MRTRTLSILTHVLRCQKCQNWVMTTQLSASSILLCHARSRRTLTQTTNTCNNSGKEVQARNSVTRSVSNKRRLQNLSLKLLLRHHIPVTVQMLSQITFTVLSQVAILTQHECNIKKVILWSLRQNLYLIRQILQWTNTASVSTETKLLKLKTLTELTTVLLKHLKPFLRARTRRIK